MSQKITDKIAALPQDGNYFSLEFFPPKTQQGFSNLHARLSRMAQALKPLFINITWGAGGSTSDKSLALAELTQKSLGITTCLHLTCTNMSRRLVDQALDQAKSLGVRNILALRGDPPRSDEYLDSEHAAEDDSNKDFTWAVDLVKYIRAKHGDYFCIGVAGYPEGHSDQSNPQHQSVDHDLSYLVEKTQAGADFIMTQLFYDVDAYLAYEKTLRSHESGAFKDITIVPGLMPVQSYQILKRTTKLSHAKLPTHILARFDAVKGDDEAVKRVGVDVICEYVEALRKTPSPGPRGFHFYTLNLEKAVAQILERSKLVSQHAPQMQLNGVAVSQQVIAEEAEADGFVIVDDVQSKTALPRNKVIVPRTRRESSSSERTSVYETTEDDIKAIREQSKKSQGQALAVAEGEGLGREATWDDFPNGRWGDARSPAYGEIDGYGVSLHVSIVEALRLWGNPTSTEDIAGLFVKHLEGNLQSMPWSEEGISSETVVIRDQLLTLIRQGWWTIASQPAVGGVPSTDKTFGWGPKNGFVFQKPFVEFFLPSADWEKLQPKLDKNEQITYFAGNAAGRFESSDEQSVNPVTWGCFAGKEIVTPTIIEAESFKSWLEEAFGIWSEWQRIYKPGSESSKLLERIRKDYWLVNVIDHGFLEKGALWDQLKV